MANNDDGIVITRESFAKYSFFYEIQNNNVVLVFKGYKFYNKTVHNHLICHECSRFFIFDGVKEEGIVDARLLKPKQKDLDHRPECKTLNSVNFDQKLVIKLKRILEERRERQELSEYVLTEEDDSEDESESDDQMVNRIGGITELWNDGDIISTESSYSSGHSCGSRTPADRSSISDLATSNDEFGMDTDNSE